MLLKIFIFHKKREVMSIELTPELEIIVEERVKEREKEIHKQFGEHIFATMGHTIKIMKEHFGEEVYDVIVNANSEGIKEHWKKKAEEHGDNSIESLIKLMWETLPQHEFEYTMEKTDAGFQMKCTKCPNAETALRLGIGEHMYYVICKGDWFSAEGFNPNIGFKMTKTLMQGDDCCNHFYYYKD